MPAPADLITTYWPLAALAGVLILILLLPVRSLMRRSAAAAAPAADTAPPPPAPPPTAVQRLAASLDQAAREKAATARVPVTVTTVPPPPRASAWNAREETPPPPPPEPVLPVLPSPPLERVHQPSPHAGHRAFGRPASLAAPRPGGRDDLKAIFGIGPRIERGLNELGIFHYDQIAAWDQRTVVWVENWFSLRGKIGRERWVRQARALADGVPLRSLRA